jgi:hypothetical protein
MAAVGRAVEIGYAFCGVMGVKNGRAAISCEPDADAWTTMLAAAVPFAQMVADRLREQPNAGDVPEWLQSLFELPDTRPE